MMMTNWMRAKVQMRNSNNHHGVQRLKARWDRLAGLICQSLFMFFILTGAANSQPIEVSTPDGQTIGFYKDYHALVVGVGEYTHWPRRPHAVNDARTVSWELKQLGFSVKLLIDPTMQALKSGLDAFVQQAGMETERGLVFYYCGNSHTTTTDGKSLGWIISKDAPLSGSNQHAFEKNAVSTYHIIGLANQIRSKHALFLFDAPLSADLFEVETPVMKMVSRTDVRSTRQFITSGRNYGPVSKPSTFRQFLLQGLNGEADVIHDGVISGSELGVYLADRVPKATHGQLNPQFGTITGSGDIGGDFIFRKTAPLLDTARLSVDAKPPSAAIQILNIKPRFRQAIELKPGRYQLHVSANGFETVTRPIDLQAGEDRTETIVLAKSKEIPQAMRNSLGMDFVRIRPGSFMMGSPASESGRSNDERQHRVKLTRGFFMQRTEVTIGQFKDFVAATGYRTEAEKGGGCWTTGSGSGWAQKPGTSWKKPGVIQTEDALPALCVTWNDARAFAQWLSQKERHTYRLPTEAEWEYAGRAGISTPFSTGRCLSTEEANYAKTGHHYQRCVTVFRNKRGRPVTAGVLAPNPWKLHNMHGNVSEWCQDWYGPYPSGQATNPKGPKSGSERVMRGGHWQADATGCRSAKRRRFPPNFASDVVGFRLVMAP